MNKKFMQIVAVAFATISTAAIAEDKAPKDDEKVEVEKCYGIASAGYNDCRTDSHSCSQKGQIDNDIKDFIITPKGTCLKIKGSSSSKPQ
jgi:uncharacterized membrane protein